MKVKKFIRICFYSSIIVFFFFFFLGEKPDLMPGNLLIKQTNDHQIKLKGQYLQAYLPAKLEAPNGLLF